MVWSGFHGILFYIESATPLASPCVGPKVLNGLVGLSWQTPVLGTILLLLYCTFLKHQYNILQYSPPPIQYIAIFLNTNTIYCNILNHQYNILQYSEPPIQYIGKNILQYIFYQSKFGVSARHPGFTAYYHFG